MSDILHRIDSTLDEWSIATAPSMDSDYGFGHAAEVCAIEGLCWKCLKADAVDEIRGSGLCTRCIDELQWPGPPEPEPVHVRRCSEFCRCRDRLAERSFRAIDEALTRDRAEMRRWRNRIRRVWRAVAREWAAR